jgi:hypothetical protein
LYLTLVEKDQWYDVKVPMLCTFILVPKEYRLAGALRAIDEEQSISPMQYYGPEGSTETFSSENKINLSSKLLDV